MSLFRIVLYFSFRLCDNVLQSFYSPVDRIQGNRDYPLNEGLRGEYLCKQLTIERASSNLALLCRRAAVYCKSNLSSSFFRFQTESVDIHQDVLQAVNLLLIVSMAPLILILPAISFLYKQSQEPRAKNLTILIKISCSVVLATTLRYKWLK